MDYSSITATRPVFITGSGRCGTTLLRRLFLEHTHIAIPPENYTLSRSDRIWEETEGDWARFCRRVMADLQKSRGEHWATYKMDGERTGKILAGLPEAMRTIPDMWNVFHALWAESNGRRFHSRWGDKTPLNVTRLGAINRMFPDARYIFLVRDGYDSTYSYAQMPGRMGAYEEGAMRWVNANTQLRKFAARHPDRSIIVRYEDMVTDTDAVLKTIFEVAAIERSFGGEVEGALADVQHWPHLGNVLNAVNSDSIGKGRRALEASGLEQVRAIIANVQTQFGYPL